MNIITNNDVISQHIGNTIRTLANMNVNEGADSMEIHKWALQTIAKELIFCWELIKDNKQ